MFFIIASGRKLTRARAALRFAGVAAALSCYLLSYQAVGSTYQALGSKSNEPPRKRPMEEVIVMAFQSASLIDMPRSVNVITRHDIERSGAQDIQSLLARQANITLNSVTGNGKFTKVDIRGSGDTSTSNVLVLVDGIRINTPDLNGAEFSVVPLSQIERIEVVRGGNAVRYGSGASQGVINVITRKNLSGTGIRLSSVNGFNNADADRFDGNPTKIDWHKISRKPAIANNTAGAFTANDKHVLSLDYDNLYNEGYREHNRMIAESWLARYLWKPLTQYQVQLIGRQHDHHYELPGPLSIDELNTPTFSNPLVQRAGSNDDSSVSIVQRWQPSSTLEILSSSFYRDRYSDFWQVKDASNTIDEIKLISRGSDLIVHRSLYDNTLKFSLGYEYQEDQYSRTNGGNQQQINSKLALGSLRKNAGFIAATIRPMDALRLNIGYRYDITHSRFNESQVVNDGIPDTSSPDCVIDPIFGPLGCPEGVITNITQSRKKRWRNEAFEIGVSADVYSDAKVYLSYANTFRVPNVDEQVLSPESLPPVSRGSLMPLEPQSADRYELGYKFQADWLDGSLGLFRSKTVKEILYRPASNVSGVNFNAPSPIDREGMELSLNYYANAALSFSLNAGYVHVRDSRGLRFPLVAEQNRSLGIHYSNNNWNADLNIRHLNERLDGNDFSNNLFDGGLFKLDSHTVSDLRIGKTLFAKKAKTEIFLIINNLANEQYISTAYSQTVYPANGRSLLGGITFEI